MVKKLLVFIVSIFLVFQVLWGLNYHRAGSASQLSIEPQEYTTEELLQLTDSLTARLNTLIPIIKPTDSAVWFNFDALRAASIANYKRVNKKYSFLRYNMPSIKKMLLPAIGGYGGFTGYINPFTNEAQVDNDIPGFARASVMSHEMAHQIGYAAEEEANMVGFLAARESNNPAIKYSVYQDMLMYASRQLYRRDSVLAKASWENVPALVKAHRAQARAYYASFENPAQPLFDWFYDSYLKANNQDKGIKSYSYVTAWLIAYAKKYGWQNL